MLGTDFRTPDGAAAGTLAFGPGVTARAIRLTLLRQGDTLADGARTIELTLSAPEAASLLDEMTESQLDLVVAGTGDAVLMVESEAKELPEDIMLGAVMFGHRHFQPVAAWREG